MEKNYRTIYSDYQSNIEIKKSRFICSLKRVYSEKEAKDFIEKIKKEHWKASHNCNAFIISEKDAVQRSSDDGEPSGTAGIPMLEVLKNNNLTNVLAIVTRYFGGIKLGTGGLIRAYSQSVSHALDQVGLVERKLQQEIMVTIPYTNLDKLHYFLEKNEYTIRETYYTENVVINCSIDYIEIDVFIKKITDFLNGQVNFKQGKQLYNEIKIVKQ